MVVQVLCVLLIPVNKSLSLLTAWLIRCVVCSAHWVKGSNSRHLVDEPDDAVLDTQGLSLIDLAERGTPLSALGIRALWKLCIDGLVFNSLEQADSIQSEVSKRLVSGPPLVESEVVPEGVSIN